MNKLQKLTLAALRESGFGPTRTEKGARWVETTADYAKLFEPAEDGSRPVSEKDFAHTFVELQELGLVESSEAGAFVRLGDLGLKADQPQPKKKEPAVPVFDVKTAATSELIAKYNELNPDKPVKKFADRATAEKRVAAALQALAKLAPAPAPAAKAPRSAPAPAAQKPDRSDERYVRNNVSVGGVVYKSVADAFKKIGLPMSRHIPFRAKVKTEGQATFEHDGKSYVFKKVEQAKIAE